MNTDLIYYGNLEGDIDRILISRSLKDHIVTCKDGVQYLLENVTRAGEVYINGEWIPYFKKQTDLQFLHYIYLMIEIIELNEAVFPSKKSSA